MEMKHPWYVDTVYHYIHCRADRTSMSHRNRELVVPLPDEGHLRQPCYSVRASVEILFIYFTSFCLISFKEEQRNLNSIIQ